jgi:uncharacterized protein (TIGR02246 family)
MDRAHLTDWITRYIDAWRDNDPVRIAALFTDDAVYFPEPYSAGWAGTAEIVAGWLARKDEPDSFEFEWDPVAIENDVAVIRGEATYRDPPTVYSNLWVLRLAEDGRCREFREWWMTSPARQ